MRVLSCFDGISCGQVALERAGFHPSIYMAAEIERDAIKVTQANYPNTVQLGDVKQIAGMIRNGLIGQIDLLMGGSPCQGFSRAGKQLGFIDPRSQLLFDFVEIKTLLKPKYWLLENVKMKAEDVAFVSLMMGVKPVIIDSALFSAQRRKRLYWTNIPIASIVDRNVSPWMIMDWANNVPNSFTWHEWWKEKKEFQLRKKFSTIINNAKKGQTLTARSVASWNANLVQLSENDYRFISTLEAERMQTLPEKYTSCVDNSAAYKAIGNGWTVDVIAHIMRGMQL